MKLFLFLLFFYLNKAVFSRDYTINFIKQYLENEFKLAIFIDTNLCWRQDEKIKLFKELSTNGIRFSTKFGKQPHLQDNALLFFVDLDCPKADAAFYMSTLLRSPYRWLAIYDQNKSEFNKQLLWDLPLLVDSDFVLAERNGNNFTLFELYKPSSNGTTFSYPRGHYDGKFKDTRAHREIFRRRQDIMGHPLIMSNVIQDSNSSMYHLLQEDRLELEYDGMAKLSWMNVRLAFEMLNATSRYIFSYRYGYKSNGEWSGMIHDLSTGKADLGTNCAATKDRLDIAVFTDCVAKFGLKFIFRQPPLAYVANIFALPFSISVWLALFVTLVASIFTMYLATKWEASKIGIDQFQLDGSVGDAMLLTMSAFSQQGCSKEPRNMSGRIMLWVVFTALMAVYAAYCANIVVLLQASSSSINTLEQLANSKMTIAALDVDYNHFLLKVTNDPVRYQIYKKLEPEKKKPNYFDLEQGVDRIRKGLFAFHAIPEQIYRQIEKTFMETEKCDLMEIAVISAVEPYVPVYKHSPYLELLKVAFKRIHESGIQSALGKRVRISKPKCSEVSAFSSVTFLNIEPLVFFMLYGVAISIVILGAEILIHKMELSSNVFDKITRKTAVLQQHRNY